MDKTSKRSIIRDMWKMLKLSFYLDQFIKTRPLDDYAEDMKSILRETGIQKGEFPKFLTLLQGKKQFKGETILTLEDRISDAQKTGFLEKQEFITPRGMLKLLRLGINGRKLVNGSWWMRGYYFFSLLYEKEPVFYWFLLGVVSTILGLSIWKAIYSWVLNIDWTSLINKVYK
jgi:hypothetical protein